MPEFFYDPKTGKLWREAGCLSGNGYRQVWFEGKQEMEHRVIWFLHYGEWPKLPIDHINGKRADNRIENMRLATPSQNGFNRRRPKNNTSGHKGVSWNSKRRAWQATIRYEGTNKNLGYFATREKASSVYHEAALQYHGEFARPDL